MACQLLLHVYYPSVEIIPIDVNDINYVDCVDFDIK